MDEELIKKLKYIRLGWLLANWDHCLTMAQKGNFSHARLLEYVIEQEYQIKRENSRKAKLSRAKIPEPWVMETFPFERQPKLNRKKIVNLYDAFDYMSKSRNIIFIGPTGTGKTGLATAFLTHAIDKGYNGRFIELGYVEVEPIQVGLFFTLMHKRHRKKSSLITSNLGFSQWASFLNNQHLTAALVDRLTENSHVINMRNCVSLRTRLEEVPG
ncbi:MAG: ATP-binding protein [Deltaproteobacteria bacterium]|nr:ATP-binding protein [Deltaproteobacteria bacterium]